MNKKSILLAGAAILLANSANAMELNPYIGLDYVFSKADYKSEQLRVFDTNKLEDKYNSGMVSMGIRPFEYMSLEAFFQQSAEEKGQKFINASGAAHKLKSEFYAYGLDAYGYLPIGCDGFSLLGTVGLANYNIKIKSDSGSVDKQKMGYRAGIGAQYDIDDNWAVRLVGRYSYIDSDYLDNLQEVTAGIRYTF